MVWEDYEATISQAFGAEFGLSYDTYGISQMLVGGVAGESSEYGVRNTFRNLIGQDPNYVNQDVANHVGERYGLSYNKPIRKTILAQQLKAKKQELAWQSINNRAPNTWGSVGAGFGAGILASIADPIELAASVLMPATKVARISSMTSKMGKTGGRLASGAIDGVAGAAAIEPFRVLMANKEQSDYTMYDGMVNVAFGGIIGAGGKYIGGKISDRSLAKKGINISDKISESANIKSFEYNRAISPEFMDRIGRTSAETKRAVMRSALADAMENRPINIDPILRADPVYSAPLTKIIRSDSVSDPSALRVPQIERIVRDIPMENIAITKVDTKPSRGQAESRSAELSKSGGRFAVERNKKSGQFEVFKVSDAAVVKGEDGKEISFSNKKDVVKKVKHLSVRSTDTDIGYHYIKRGKGKNSRYYIVSGKGIDETDIANMSKSVNFISKEFTPEIKSPEVEFNQYVRDFVESKKVKRSHFFQDVKTAPNPKDVDIDKELIEFAEQNDVDNYPFREIIDTLDEDIKNDFIGSLDEAIAAKKDFDNFKSKKENIMALADCMGG